MHAHVSWLPGCFTESKFKWHFNPLWQNVLLFWNYDGNWTCDSPRLETSSQFIRSFGGAGGRLRVLHQKCCRSHHVISTWNLIMHRIPDLYNFILNFSETPTLHSSKPTTSPSSSRPSSSDSPSCQSFGYFPNSVPPAPNVPLHAKASRPVVVTSVCTVILVMAVIGIVFLLVLRKRRRCYQRGLLSERISWTVKWVGDHGLLKNVKLRTI